MDVREVADVCQVEDVCEAAVVCEVVNVCEVADVCEVSHVCKVGRKMKIEQNPNFNNRGAERRQTFRCGCWADLTLTTLTLTDRNRR